MGIAEENAGVHGQSRPRCRLVKTSRFKEVKKESGYGTEAWMNKLATFLLSRYINPFPINVCYVSHLQLKVPVLNLVHGHPIALQTQKYEHDHSWLVL